MENKTKNIRKFIQKKNLSNISFVWLKDRQTAKTQITFAYTASTFIGHTQACKRFPEYYV